MKKDAAKDGGAKRLDNCLRRHETRKEKPADGSVSCTDVLRISIDDLTSFYAEQKYTGDSSAGGRSEREARTNRRDSPRLRIR